MNPTNPITTIQSIKALDLLVGRLGTVAEMPQSPFSLRVPVFLVDRNCC